MNGFILNSKKRCVAFTLVMTMLLCIPIAPGVSGYEVYATGDDIIIVGGASGATNFNWSTVTTTSKAAFSGALQDGATVQIKKSPMSGIYDLDLGVNNLTIIGPGLETVISGVSIKTSASVLTLQALNIDAGARTVTGHGIEAGSDITINANNIKIKGSTNINEVVGGDYFSHINRKSGDGINNPFNSTTITGNNITISGGSPSDVSAMTPRGLLGGDGIAGNVNIRGTNIKIIGGSVTGKGDISLSCGTGINGNAVISGADIDVLGGAPLLNNGTKVIHGGYGIYGNATVSGIGINIVAGNMRESQDGQLVNLGDGIYGTAYISGENIKVTGGDAPVSKNGGHGINGVTTISGTGIGVNGGYGRTGGDGIYAFSADVTIMGNRISIKGGNSSGEPNSNYGVGAGRGIYSKNLTIKAKNINIHGGNSLGGGSGGSGIQSENISLLADNVSIKGGNGGDENRYVGGNGGHGIFGNLTVIGNNISAKGGNGGAGKYNLSGGEAGDGIKSTILTIAGVSISAIGGNATNDKGNGGDGIEGNELAFLSGEITARGGEAVTEKAGLGIRKNSDVNPIFLDGVLKALGGNGKNENSKGKSIAAFSSATIVPATIEFNSTKAGLILRDGINTQAANNGDIIVTRSAIPALANLIWNLTEETAVTAGGVLSDAGIKVVTNNTENKIWLGNGAEPDDPHPDINNNLPQIPQNPPSGNSSSAGPGIIKPEINEDLPFTDIEDHWAKEAIITVYNKGLMNGTEAAKFSPDLNLDRGMIATILGRLYEMANGNNIVGYYDSVFNDVKQGSYYYTYVNWGAAEDIIDGVGNDANGVPIFEPERAVTRQEMAKLVDGFLKSMKIELNQNSQIKTFTDQDAVSDWAIESVLRMQSAGIIKGRTDGTFDPQSTMTRAEASIIIERLINLI